MVQAMLADRFKLKVHRTTSTVPCFALVVAKDGPKNMKKVPDDAKMKWDWSGRSDLTAKATSVTQLLEIVLSPRIECPISDRTGLTGKYDFRLEWTPESAPMTEPNGGGAPSSDPSGSSIFSAVQQQLGLRLQPAKVVMESIVIDHIERPSEN